MDFRESDVSSDNDTDREMCGDVIDLRRDVESDKDDCDGTVEEDYWYIPLDEEDAEDMLEIVDEIADDTKDDLSKIEEVPEENSCIDAGIPFAEPSENMLFDSWEQAETFYNDYANHVGFSVRIQAGHRDTKGHGVAMKDRPFVTRLFVCSNEGFRRERKKQDEDSGEHGGFRHMVKRTGCQAMLSVKKIKDSDKWTVVEFKKDHNHPMMSPGKRRYLRSNRRTLSVEKRVLETDTDAFMQPVGAISFMGQVASGPQNLGFNERQCRHSKFQKRKLSVNDIETIYQYCQHMSIQDPMFFYAIQNDNKGRMTNFFWVDGRARSAYHYFGDVVTFDSTYRKNKYKMPFALFIGVNHHCKNISFGCALVQDETKATFIWLFRTWLQAMSNRPPVSIITVQDAAMRAAIKKVFPETCHRFCFWHILKKLPEYFPSVYHKYPSFKKDLLKCLHKTYSEEQFEMCWREFVHSYKVEEHPHATLMYAIRKHWVPAYLRDTFFADMKSRQRSESTDLIFSKVLKPRTTLQGLINNYKMIEDKRYEEENHADFIDIDRFPNLKTRYPIEKHAATIYTKEVFEKFQTQLFNSCGYIFQEKERDDENIIYSVRNHGEGFRSYIVTLNLFDKSVICSCRMFEYAGILCRHVLNIFLHHQFLKIPSHYILKRWTKDAKKGGAFGGAGINIHSDSKKATMLRFNDILQESKNIAQEACENEEQYEMVLSGLKRISEELASFRTDNMVVEPQGPKPNAPRRAIIGELLDKSVIPRNINILLDPLPISTKEPSGQDLHCSNDHNEELQLSLDIPEISPTYHF